MQLPELVHQQLELAYEMASMKWSSCHPRDAKVWDDILIDIASVMDKVADEID